MLRPRRESLHSDGITDQKSLQRISATKSAQSRHIDEDSRLSAFGGEADIHEWCGFDLFVANDPGCVKTHRWI